MRLFIGAIATAVLCASGTLGSRAQTVAQPSAQGPITLADAIRRAEANFPAFATAAADSADFYVYENWLAGPHKVVLHRSSCGQCNHGKGRPAGHDANHARWHGPYPTLSGAREASHQMAGVLIRSECKCI